MQNLRCLAMIISEDRPTSDSQTVLLMAISMNAIHTYYKVSAIEEIKYNPDSLVILCQKSGMAIAILAVPVATALNSYP